MRLIPATKLKPDSGSPFHGIELGDKLPMPFAWVIPSDAKSYELTKGSETMTPGGDVPRRVIVPLTGKARIEAGERFFQTSKDAAIWLRARDLDIAAAGDMDFGDLRHDMAQVRVTRTGDRLHQIPGRSVQCKALEGCGFRAGTRLARVWRPARAARRCA